MFPFWDIVLGPLIDALEPRRAVEIGALRGETTVRLLERLGPEAELHVIDPVPEFDPGEHERAFPGRYVFHRAPSLEVLPELPAVDLALVDGDHNWYTVYNELKLLAARAREAERSLPVLVLHDVCWPYGRRDLYYEPDRVPAEFRQPHAQRGMKRARAKLLDRGGLNPQLNNALVEGGPRNGVATALDDFLGEHDRPVRRLVIPIYFGLAVVAEEERLAGDAQLAEFFEWLDGIEAHKLLLDLADELYAGAMVAHHSVLFPQRDDLDRGARRYLDQLEAVLLDEHYLENELRNHYLSVCLRKGTEPDPHVLRDPANNVPDEMRRLIASRATGRLAGDGNDTRAYFPYTSMGRKRLDQLRACLDTVRAEAVAGDLVECGTGRGGGAIFLRGYLEAREIRDKAVWVVDTFRAAAEHGGRSYHPQTGDLNAVREGFARFGLLDERVRFLQGGLADTLVDAPVAAVALLHIGASLEGDPGEALDLLYDRVTTGGFVVIEDFGSAHGAAVDAFRERHGITEPLERSGAAGAFWRKLEPRRAPLPASAKAVATKDLSVVVVVYEMQREAARTLHSLSRGYQEGIDDLDYEVIVVENGSAVGTELGADFVHGFGPEFRYLESPLDPTPSPVHALNRGIAAASGKTLALMIDGAHVLTPGVLRYGMAGLREYGPAIVATQQWYVGPGQQHEAVHDGYDQEYEDRLFAQIGWPSRGYDLFAIGHFIGERDWLDRMGESNCLFVERALVDQVGAFDEAFSMAGGGFANLDAYERYAAQPGVTVVTILGEGSFHQVHGGTTTNTNDAVERRRRIWEYRQHYEQTRAKPFKPPAKEMHYVGHMSRGVARTRARRRIAPNLFRQPGIADRDGFPDAAAPMPEELSAAYTDAYWHSLAWQDTTWRGRVVPRSPADLHAYQELVTRIGPRWTVVTHAGDTALAGFLATLGPGRVLAVGPGADGEPGVEVVVGSPTEAETIERVRGVVGNEARTLVVLGSRAAFAQTLAEFEAYSPLVRVGDYIVIEDTIVGGHPVWPSFGAGPGDAVTAILGTKQDFAADRSLERFGPSFNAQGWLRRVAP